MNHEPVDLIRFLAEPVVVDGVTQWPLPRLAGLNIKRIKSGIVEVVSNSIRMNGGEQKRAGGVGGVPEPCVPLHLTIEINPYDETTSITQEDVKELQKVLGKSNLSCIPLFEHLRASG
ncbi:hypothetical protein FRB94_006244 [Tulasnella sp. JGI-2019a]|nr:hypothetical protein FRB94_006244 [Tulasnella sp. JGI-2019a]KAG9016469.1 hypothetical protein FRB93_010718 [Tulasnella sp. JGI-2019a]